MIWNLSNWIWWSVWRAVLTFGRSLFQLQPVILSRNLTDLNYSNPLENPLIVENVIKFLRFHHSDLISCRSVSKTWNHFATKQLLKDSSDDLNPDYSWTWFGNEEVTVEFMKIFSDSIILLSSTCNLDYLPPPRTMYQGNRNNAERTIQMDTMLTFFKSFNSKISSLEVGMHMSASDYHALLQLQGIHLINLRIRLCSNNSRSNDSSTGMEPFAAQRLHLLPNLKTLCVTTRRKYPEEDLQRFEQTISYISPRNVRCKITIEGGSGISPLLKLLKKYQQLENLKILKPHRMMEDDCVYMLKENMKLEELEVLRTYPSIHTWDEDHSISFTQFIRTQQYFLKYLTCSANCTPFPIQMFKISKLDLRIQQTAEVSRPTKAFNFSAYFPNLKNLLIIGSPHCSIYDEDNDSWGPGRPFDILDFDNFFPLQPAHKSVRSLEIRGFSLYHSTVQNISNIFQHLSSLSLTFGEDRYSELDGTLGDEEFFGSMWNCPTFAENLENLELSINESSRAPLGKSLDEIFSGASSNTITWFNVYKLFKNFDFDKAEFNSILKLKNLKSLRIKGGILYSKPFSDFTGSCIFAKMKELKTLDIQKRLVKFSKKCLRDVRDSGLLFTMSE